MLFSSMTFLFVFLPIVSGIYIVSKKELRNYVLLIASLIFYGWGEPRYLAIMIVTIFINYLGAMLVEDAKTEKRKKFFLGLTAVGNLSFLVYFKYFNFILNNLNDAFALNFDFIQVIMPIGISFYTFHGISYVVDIYRKKATAQRDLCKLALYITLFPQLVAGPIVKYHDICEQIEDRDVRFDKIVQGIKRFIIGLAKKVLIANTMAVLADGIFALPADKMDMLTAWTGAIAYSLQLYYDFSGYSDMALGLGLIFGFRFLENFNYPYISKSITEFWRRWHISLSTWFKEYLYIPLGGNRVSPVRMYINLGIVFLATGIWHGASWTFVVWGLWHGFFIIFEKATGWSGDFDKLWINVSKHIYTILVFVVGWVLFRADDFVYAFEFIKNMFSMGNVAIGEMANAIEPTRKELIMMVFAVIASVPLFRNILFVKYERKVLRTVINLWLFALLFWSTATLASSTYNPFIYFRF